MELRGDEKNKLKSFIVLKTIKMTNITSLAWDVGAHTEFGGSVYNSLKISIDNGMYATQFFLGSPYSLVRNKPTTLDIENSKKLLSRFPLHVFSHFPYLSNLAGSIKSLAWNGDQTQDEKTTRLIESIEQELLVLSNFTTENKNSGVVIHPGSFPNNEKGLHAVSKSINKINFPPNSKLILENCAGEGTKLAKNFTELKTIIDGVEESKRKHLGVCIDTAHIWGAGEYDLSHSHEVKRMFHEFDTLLGRDRLTLIHLNDSEIKFGGKRDKHECIGEGYIWKESTESLLFLLDVCRNRNTPLILETEMSDLVTMANLSVSRN